MAAPPNDLFANAQIIGTASGAVSGTTFDATTEVGEPVVGVQSVWYVWTCPADGWYKFTIPRSGHVYHGDFGFDNSFCNLAVFPTGTLTQMTTANVIVQSLGQLSELIAGWDCEVAFFATAASVYYIKVSTSGSTNDATFDFDLIWTDFDPPANDDFVDAIEITSVPTTLTLQTTRDAVFETGAESKDNVFSQHDKEQSVWYKFIPPTTGRYRIGLPPGDIVHNGHYTEGTDPNPEVNGDDHWNITAQISTGTTISTFQAGEIGSAGATQFTSPNQQDIATYVELTAATEYYIRVYTHYSSKTFNDIPFNSEVVEFTLEVEGVVAPANDNFDDATVLSTTLPGLLVGEATTNSWEEVGEPEDFPYEFSQSIWYSFTPAITGKYRFQVPLDSLEYEGGLTPGNGELVMSIAPAASGIADHIAANALPNGSYDVIFQYPESGWQNPHNLTRVVDLIASTEYILRLVSNGGNTPQFNREVVKFDLHWELITPPANDDFDDATVLTGASGTEAFSALGSSVEADEPPSFYWNYDFDELPTIVQDSNGGTVWFEWTCPATGWYKFMVESTAFSSATHDIAIYTGSALNALTRINSAWGGTDPNASSPRETRTAVGFNATNGVTYRIQVAGWQVADEEAAQIVWATMSAPVGNSAASAVVGRFNALIDNYGHDDTDLPPNGVTLLSGHDEWWYTDGAFGKTKWFKYTAPDDVTIRVSMQQWAETNELSGVSPPADCGLIAYKGADFASLTVAQGWNRRVNPDELENVAMLVTSGGQVIDDVLYEDFAYTVGPPTKVGTPIPEIPVAQGETLWICVFGLYDNDYNGDGVVPAEPYHAAEFNANISFDILPPVNDNVSPVITNSIWGFPDYLYNLHKSDWYDDLTFGRNLAGQKQGTTYGATTQVGEQAHGGYGPTRSVWYYGTFPIGQTKFWVEADEDCVISIYSATEPQSTAPDPATLVSLGEDDDSGTGNWPEVTVDFVSGGQSAWVCIDSKVETNFTLKWEWINTHPNPPVNNDFEDAIAITGPIVVHGTTVGASAEYFETDSFYIGSGPADTVWYKWTAPTTQQIVISGRCLTNNEDAYVVADVWTGPDKDNLTMVSDPGEGGIFYGPHFPNSTNDEIFLDVVSGTEYYIRVMTEAGASEEFELWIDTEQVFLKLTPGGTEDQPGTDFATVPLKFTVSGTELKKSPTLDAITVPLRLTPSGFDDIPNTDEAEIYLDLQPSGTELEGFAPVDAASLYLRLEPISLEMHIHECFAGEGNPDVRWYGEPTNRWTTDQLTPDVRFFSHLHKGAQYC